MTIGLDIDDTMTNSSELIAEYVKKHFKTNDPVLINNILHASEINDEIMSFYNKYLPIMTASYTLKSNVKEVIDRLRSKGHKIIIITARAHSIKRGLMKITRDYLKKYNIVVDGIIFKARDKIRACKDNNVDLMIDDAVKKLEQLDNIGIDTLLFTTVGNKNINTNIKRVNNWIELEKYIDNHN